MRGELLKPMALQGSSQRLHTLQFVIGATAPIDSCAMCPPRFRPHFVEEVR